MSTVPSYHYVFVTTAEIQRSSIFNLPFGVRLTCTRTGGWELWNCWRGKEELLAGEYNSKGLRIDVAGHIIVDSLSSPAKSEDPLVSPISIASAEKIAKDFGYDQVIIIGRKVGSEPKPHGEHVTTYGTTYAHCDAAARIGDHLKYNVMGWVKENVVSHEWTEVTAEFLKAPPQWFYGDLWAAIGQMAREVRYEWVQGHDPDKLTGDGIYISAIGVKVMPLKRPEVPDA